jgi:hypothetical protein
MARPMPGDERRSPVEIHRRPSLTPIPPRGGSRGEACGARSISTRQMRTLPSLANLQSRETAPLSNMPSRRATSEGTSAACLASTRGLPRRALPTSHAWRFFFGRLPSFVMEPLLGLRAGLSLAVHVEGRLGQIAAGSSYPRGGRGSRSACVARRRVAVEARRETLHQMTRQRHHPTRGAPVRFDREARASSLRSARDVPSHTTESRSLSFRAPRWFYLGPRASPEP